MQGVYAIRSYVMHNCASYHRIRYGALLPTHGLGIANAWSGIANAWSGYCQRMVWILQTHGLVLPTHGLDIANAWSEYCQRMVLILDFRSTMQRACALLPKV
jgi:hypothetical protein